MNNKHYFLVACSGHCATKWLANILQLHTDIYCSHGNGSKPGKEAETKRENRAINSVNHSVIPLQDYFELETFSHPNTPNIGNVHGYTIRSIIENLKQFPSLRLPLSIANLVRNPINFTASAHANFYKKSLELTIVRQEILSVFNQRYDEMQALAKRHNINFIDDWSFLSFIWACNMLQVMNYDYMLSKQLANGIPTFRMEDITSSKTELLKLLNVIISKDTEITNQYLTQIFEVKAVNKHRDRVLTDEEQFNKWSDWQRELFIKSIHTNNALENYRSMGYDLEDINTLQTIKS